jgi:hypothetical protein
MYIMGIGKISTFNTQKVDILPIPIICIIKSRALSPRLFLFFREWASMQTIALECSLSSAHTLSSYRNVPTDIWSVVHRESVTSPAAEEALCPQHIHSAHTEMSPRTYELLSTVSPWRPQQQRKLSVLSTYTHLLQKCPRGHRRISVQWYRTCTHE